MAARDRRAARDVGVVCRNRGAPVVAIDGSLLSGTESAWLTSRCSLGSLPARSWPRAQPGRHPATSLVRRPGARLPAALFNLVLLRAGHSVLPAACLTGMALAGVYPPAMKMAATWFRAERGLAIGAIVGALDGRKSVALPAGKRQQALIRDGCHGAVDRGRGCIRRLSAGIATARHAFPARPFSWTLMGVVWGSGASARYRRISRSHVGVVRVLGVDSGISGGVLHGALTVARRRIWPFACVAIGGVGCISAARAPIVGGAKPSFAGH